MLKQGVSDLFNWVIHYIHEPVFLIISGTIDIDILYPIITEPLFGNKVGTNM